MEEEKTIINDPNEGNTFWENEFTGEGIDQSELEFSIAIAQNHCSEHQYKMLEQTLDSAGNKLGSSRILVKRFAQIGDKMLAAQDKHEKSKGRAFYGSSMDDAANAAIDFDTKYLINEAITSTRAELARKGRRSLPAIPLKK